MSLPPTLICDFQRRVCVCQLTPRKRDVPACLFAKPAPVQANMHESRMLHPPRLSQRRYLTAVQSGHNLLSQQYTADLRRR